MQKDELSLQCLLSSHSPEQQSPFSAHALPPVLQLSFSAVHFLSSPQAPLQQASLLAQSWPSETHCSTEHLPPTQLSEQQSVLDEHEPPASAQTVISATQPLLASHAPEQHSVPPRQESPTARQLPPVLAPAPLPAAAPPAVPLPALPLASAPEAAAAPPWSLVLPPPQPVQRTVAVRVIAKKLRAIRILNLRGVDAAWPEDTCGGAGKRREDAKDYQNEPS